MLKTLPEEDSFELLARIRAGVDTRELVEQIQHGNMLVQFASASAAGSQDSQDIHHSTRDPVVRATKGSPQS